MPNMIIKPYPNDMESRERLRPLAGIPAKKQELKRRTVNG